MEQESSMTPPNSPILQADMFEDEMMIPDEPIMPEKQDYSGMLLCCQGEPHSGDIMVSQLRRPSHCQETLQWCGTEIVDQEQHYVTLFDYQLDFHATLMHNRDKVFNFARSAISELDNAHTGTSFMPLAGDSSEYVKVRRDIRLFFDYIILWLKSEKCKGSNPSCLPGIIEDLMLLSVYIGRIRDLPTTVLGQAASKQGNKSGSVCYHYFHLCLEIHWALIETVYILSTLYPEIVANNIHLCRSMEVTDEVPEDPTTELIQLLLWDFICIAGHRHNNITAIDYHNASPFSCFCVQEITTLLIQLMTLRQQKQAKQSFWVNLTSMIQKLNNHASNSETETGAIDSYSTLLPYKVECNDVLGFSWWYLLHVTPLYNYNEKGANAQTKTSVSNYYLVKELMKKSMTLNETSLRLHMRCCLMVTSNWEPDTAFICMLWDHFYKKMNDNFKTQTTDLMGHACIQKSASTLYENCRRLAENNALGLELDSSYLLFQRLLSQFVTKSSNPHQACRQVKGRFYAKFHARRVQELTAVGLQHLATLFIVLGYIADTADICDKLCEFLMMPAAPLTASRQAAIWRGLLALVHLHQAKGLEAGYITEKLAAGFDPIVKELGDCTDPNQSSILWGLVSLYLDGTSDIIEASQTLSYQEHMLIGPGLQTLCNKAKTSELSSVLSFLQTMITKLRPPTVQTGIKEDFSKCFSYFAVGPLVNPVVSCRFLCHVLPNTTVQEALSRCGEVQEINLVHAWFRCHWHMLKDSESLQHLSRLMCERRLLGELLQEADSSTRDMETVCRFLTALHNHYATIQDFRCKMEFRERVEKYFGDVGKNLAVLKSCGSSDLTKRIYYLAGMMVQHCANLIYSNMKPNCLLPQLVDKLILPRSLVVQGKELPGNVVNALREHLHLFVSGFGCLDYRSDAYIQRKLKEMFTVYFTKFSMSSTITMSATHVHPFVGAICDDASPYRQHIIQIVITEHLNNRNTSVQGLQFILELFRKSKLNNVARDVPVLLSVLLGQLMETTQHRPQLTHAVSTLLEASRVHPHITTREELFMSVSKVIERLLPVHQGRIFKSLEGVVLAHTQLFTDLIPNMTGSLKMSEMKRGLGKDKQLRVAYCGLLNKLGPAGTAEKSKILIE